MRDPKERGLGSAQETPAGSRAVIVASSTPATAAGLADWFGRAPFVVAAICLSEEAVEPALRAVDISLVVTTDSLGDPFWTDAVRRGNARSAVPVLVLTDGPAEDEVSHLRAGATGVFPLRASRHDVLGAARDIMAGRTVASAEALRHLLEGSSGPEFTARQTQIITLLAEGCRTGEIARRLFVEPTTIKTHVARLCKMLDVPGREELVRVAPVLARRLRGARDRADADLATARAAAPLSL